MQQHVSAASSVANLLILDGEPDRTVAGRWEAGITASAVTGRGSNESHLVRSDQMTVSL